jgi:hypothetical protein
LPPHAPQPDKQDLLALILRPGPLPVAERAAERIQASTEVHSDFGVWLRELERYLPPPSDPELDEYYRYALMGVVVGFGDRNLSPFLAQHTAILPPLLEDIRSVYGQVRASGAPYSVEEFILRAFDYGIHKAYYLDWDLYLSHDMY